MGDSTLLRETISFLPLFMLYISSGMTGCFTTILIHYFQHSHPDPERYLTLLGTSEDYAQIIIAVFGGFLQQIIGPRKMLILATLPSILSWILIGLYSDHVPSLILSRVLAGSSIGLMASNVYIADCATTQNIVTFNYMRQIFVTLGAIMMYGAIQVIYKVLHIHFKYVSFMAVFPLVSFITLLCMKESPVYLERRRRLLEQSGPDQSLVKLNFEKLKFPISSPTVYIPFLLISGLISLQHFSGFTYSKRFLIQVLESATKKPSIIEGLKNATPYFGPDIPDVPIPLNTDSYYYGMMVCCVYLTSSLLVAKLLQSIRRRFMFFLSLMMTSLCLTCIGFLMEEQMLATFLHSDTVMLLKVIFLCLHVFIVQCGLQGLPSQLTDILFPTSCKSIMKGICRAVTSLTLVVFITMINLFSEYHTRFWIMAGTLIAASPFLFIFVPEIRNIGKGTALNFILPVQTVFYILLPKIDARQRWKTVIRKVSNMKAFINLIDKQLATEEAVTTLTKYTKTFTFMGDSVEFKEFETNEELKRNNRDLVSYISNILPQSGFLHKNPKENRILVGRGPTKFTESIKEKGGIFLFNDVIIVAKCLVRNWRYVNETCFNLSEIQLTRDQEMIKISSPSEGCITLAFGDVTEADTWKRYIEFCQDNLEKTINKAETESHL